MPYNADYPQETQLDRAAIQSNLVPAALNPTVAYNPDLDNQVVQQPNNSGRRSLWGDIQSMGPTFIGKAATPLGVGGASLLHGVASALQYLTGAPMTGTTNKLLEDNVAEMARAWGIGGQPTPNPVASKNIPKAEPNVAFKGPVMNAEDIVRGGQQGGQNTPPVNDLNGIYDKLHKISDSQFKEFVDARHGVPGVGYIIGQDGTMKRLIDNPANKPQEPLSIGQADALAKLVTAQGHLAYGLGTRKQAETTQQWAHEDRVEKQRSVDADRIFKTHAVQEYNPEAAKMEINDMLTYAKMAESGNVPELFKPDVDNFKKGFENFYQRGLAQSKIRDSREARNDAWSLYKKKFTKYPATPAQ